MMNKLKTNSRYSNELSQMALLYVTQWIDRISILALMHRKQTIALENAFEIYCFFFFILLSTEITLLVNVQF